jgi:AraC-like DNA-binding protein
LFCTDVDLIVRQLFEDLSGEEDYQHTIDPRIAEALAIIGRAAEKIPAQELSKGVFLSSDRFGHLFKDVVGVPLRRYLLWRRLLAALEYIAAGNTFTFAAHEASFTDSAHLSRTFRQMFGLSLSAMFARRDQFRFVFCTQQLFPI